MAAATRDLDPATFDPAGDLLGYVTDLQLSSLVGMVDPPARNPRPRWLAPTPPTSGSAW
jgi:Ca2+-transporting ATPase